LDSGASSCWGLTLPSSGEAYSIFQSLSESFGRAEGLFDAQDLSALTPMPPASPGQVAEGRPVQLPAWGCLLAAAANAASLVS